MVDRDHTHRPARRRRRAGLLAQPAARRERRRDGARARRAARGCATARSTGDWRRSRRRWTGGSASSTPRSTAGMEHAAKQTNAIHKQLGEVGQATVQMAEQAKGLSELQEILRPPKARGGFGELLLENLLARPAAGDGVRVPVRLRGRRARRRGDQGRPDRPDRLQVPARQLRADAARRQRHRAPAVREAVRARREVARRRDLERSTSGPTRAPTTSPSCTCRRRRSTTSSPAAAPARCSRTHTRSGCCPSRRRR